MTDFTDDDMERLIRDIVPKADAMFPALFEGKEHGTLLILEPGSPFAIVFGAPDVILRVGVHNPPPPITDVVAFPWWYHALPTREVIAELRALLSSMTAIELGPVFCAGLAGALERLETPPPTEAAAWVFVGWGFSIQVAGVARRPARPGAPPMRRPNAPGGSA